MKLFIRNEHKETEYAEEGTIRAIIAIIVVLGYVYTGMKQIDIPGIKEIVSFVIGFYFAKSTLKGGKND